eukprot:TRINITY_DN7526_c1_g1_i1.p1 TRINITY_DN7526_c1_g1~~TRINITY_DN7526_c1_g1_i1.p1  ORF type:complete len:484 (+),score=157.52 TRINITY_DN7526_c1_g1_i1:146-1597(+)
MEESHYRSHNSFRLVGKRTSPRAGSAEGRLVEERVPLLDFDDVASYGSAEDVRSTLITGSATLKRVGSDGLHRAREWVNVYGPGLVCMLAAADAGSLVTSAELGKEWGFAMVLWQLLLIYPLYITQELTVRLGAATRMGHGQLIQRKYGTGVALTVVVMVAVTCVGGVVQQLSTLVEICDSVGLNPPVTCISVVAVFTAITVGGYSIYIEKVCLALGLCEVVFFLAFLSSPPAPWRLAEGVVNAFDFRVPGFGFMLAAYVGSALSPWMMFYEQSAVVDKELDVREVPAGRKDTLIGVALAQTICCAVTLTIASRKYHGAYNGEGIKGFGGISQVASALAPGMFDKSFGRHIVFLGFIGASMNAMLVVGLTAVFGLAEVTGLKHGKKSFLKHPVREQPVLYSVFIGILVVATVVALLRYDLIALSLTVNGLNTALLPVSMFFLVQLASDPDVLPPSLLLTGWHKRECTVVLACVSCGSAASLLL